jgi:hypothetical protein
MKSLASVVERTSEEYLDSVFEKAARRLEATPRLAFSFASILDLHSSIDRFLQWATTDGDRSESARQFGVCLPDAYM